MSANLEQGIVYFIPRNSLKFNELRREERVNRARDDLHRRVSCERAGIKGGVSVSTLLAVVRRAHSLFSQSYLVREARDRELFRPRAVQEYVCARKIYDRRITADHHSSPGRQRRVASKLGCCHSSERRGCFSKLPRSLAYSRPRERMFSRWPSIAREET